ncbi:hypothetical protein [Croceiramulus getboli]|nr:hypothetical protein P8624_07410 [Flavobacteriaceae bacterium YJPT1-3]
MRAQTKTLQLQFTDTIPADLQDQLEYPILVLDSLGALEARDSVNKQLQRWGYFQPSANLQQNADTLILNYRPGPSYRYLLLRHPQLDPELIPKLSTLERIDSTHFVISTPLLPELLETLTRRDAQRGRPLSSYQLQQLSPAGKDTLSALLIAQRDQNRLLDSVVIKGYTQAPQSFLRKAGLRTGYPFNQRTIERADRNLLQLPFLKTVKPSELLFTESGSQLYLYLEKVNRNSFSGFLGFSTDEETNNLRLDGYLDLVLINNLNFGEELEINYKSDGNDQQNFRVRTALPFLLKTPLGLAGELRLFRKDSTFSTAQLQAELFYQINTSWRTGVGYSSNTSSNLLENNTSAELSSYDARFLTLTAAHTRLTSDYLDPVRTRFEAEIALGSRSAQDGEEDQIRFRESVHHLFTLNAKNRVFLRNETVYLASDTYLTNELFRIGGINSIRGFTENSIFVNLSTYFNTEYRYLLNPDLYVHSIFDAGYFENAILDQRERLFAFGFGAALNTRSGVLKINIANGIPQGEAVSFQNIRIHISLFTVF